jgi:hypothetical protein
MVKSTGRHPGRTEQETHTAEHLRFWHLEQGNEKAASVAEQWVHDLDRTKFPEPS